MGKLKIKKHKHIWKYYGNNVRICEAPIPTIESCGKIEMFCSHHKKYHEVKSSTGIK